MKLKKYGVLISLFLLVSNSAVQAVTNTETTVPVPSAPSPAVMPTPPANPTNNFASPTAAHVPTVIPPAPNIDAKGYILIDANSGYIIAQKNAMQQMPPASLTKLMTIYLTFDAVKRGQIRMEDNVTISEKAWRTGGSRMFVKVNSQVPVQDLLDGVIVASGNDAAEALAEFVGGSDASFIDRMNQMAAALGMSNTHFMDPTGLPDPNHHSTPYDLALLVRALILNFPDHYPMFKVKYITYNNIKQPNRNSLLWRDSSVDGLKTGHTDEAGYCLISSANRDGMRLISVVMGAASARSRTDGSEALLNYGFRYYETHKIYNAGTQLAEPRVWYGVQKNVPMGLARDLYVTVPKGQYQRMNADVVYNQKLTAPIIQGHSYGIVKVSLNGKTLAAEQLVALANNPQGGIWVKLRDHVASLFKKA